VRGRRVVTVLSERRYETLAGVLVVLMLSHTLKQKWGSGIDVWEHIAAARELAAHPLHPHHPLLPLDAPHQFFTPYTLVLALVVRLTGWHVLTAFAVAGLANFALVLYGIRRFVHALGGSDAVAFYTLVFTVFLWGSEAWFYSGFLHFDVLAHVLSYPSTFAFGLSLVALTLQVRFLDTGRLRYLGGIVAAGVVVLVSHPITFAFLVIGTLSLAVGKRPVRSVRAVADTGAALGAAGALAMLWPYFSVYDLLVGGSEVTRSYRAAVDGANHELYAKAIQRLLLALVAIPFVIARVRRGRNDPLALMALGLAAVYAYGWVYNVGSFSRSLTFLHFVSVTILAEELVRAQGMLAHLGTAAAPARRFVAVFVAALVAMGVFNLRNGFKVLPDSMVSDLPYEWAHDQVGFTRFDDFRFLEEHHDDYPVVIADVYTSLEVPAFGSRTVAFARVQPFVDTNERSADLGRFFSPDATEADRRAIIRRYHARLVIVTTEQLRDKPDDYEPVVALGRVVECNHRFVFIEITEPTG
jgi:hypothetical protein